jgi:queuine tRNA-ribosyltransferase
MKPITFTIKKKMDGSLGRVGTLTTPHGTINTPSFVVVGTKATVKGLTPLQLEDMNVQVVLANTYHLYLQPGDEIIRDAGGLGAFMNWTGPTMTDSGGFQVFSLGAAYGKEISKVTSITDPNFLIPERSLDSIVPLAKVSNDGVSFKSHLDGSLHYITPEKSIEIQHNLAADIIFAFDECTSPTEDERYQSEALNRTHAWAKRSLDRHMQLEGEKKEGGMLPQALFGIVQGGRSESLRKKSAKAISSMEFDGFGIGGSFAKEDMSTAVKWVNEILPEEKPRHLLGIGEPEDLFMGVENGVDLFDCVGPTRIGRNGMAFTKKGKINLFNAQFVSDFSPLDEGCPCYTCAPRPGEKGYTKAYLSHLFRGKEMEAGILLSIHNVFFLNKLVSDMRQAIFDGTFFEFKESFLNNYKK